MLPRENRALLPGVATVPGRPKHIVSSRPVSPSEAGRPTPAMWPGPSERGGPDWAGAGGKGHTSTSGAKTFRDNDTNPQPPPPLPRPEHTRFPRGSHEPRRNSRRSPRAPMKNLIKEELQRLAASGVHKDSLTHDREPCPPPARPPCLPQLPLHQSSQSRRRGTGPRALGGHRATA